MPHNNLSRIQRISRFFRGLFSFLVFIVPVLTLVYWAFFNMLPEGMNNDLPVTPDTALSAQQLLLGCLANFFPVGASLYVLLHFKRLFALYEQGIIFSRQNALCFKQVGNGVVAWTVLNFLYSCAIGPILTYHRPAGERLFVIELGSNDLAALITGFLVILISWVMYEAADMEEERGLTV